jgi:DNA polymerase III sliding clamp (beta) subunit (PCNA family)
MKTNLTNLQWIELAASSDDTRQNMNGIYRDTKNLVATDGHRLHLSNDMEESKPFHLNGCTLDFPKWEQVIPKGSRVGSVKARWTFDTTKQLQAVAKLSDKTGYAEFKFSTDKLTVLIKIGSVEAKMDLLLEESVIASEFSVFLNINYFLDAISGGCHPGYKTTTFEISFFGDRQPLIIETTLGKAVIMPMLDTVSLQKRKEDRESWKKAA